MKLLQYIVLLISATFFLLIGMELLSKKTKSPEPFSPPPPQVKKQKVKKGQAQVQSPQGDKLRLATKCESVNLFKTRELRMPSLFPAKVDVTL